ncbi:MAG: hypothetical protein ABEL51_05830 [Salinibacter sp.]
MDTIDLSFLETAPDLSREAGRLEIASLCPVSMAEGPPGRAVGTELAPPDRMLYGALENAMGLHFGWDKSGRKGDPEPQGYYLRTAIADRAAADIDLGYHDRREFQSLVAPYYDFSLVDSTTGTTYYDLRWRKKWRADPQAQSGQSNDYRAETFDNNEPASLHGYQRALTRREFVEGEWTYRVRCSGPAEEALAEALRAPKAPLYLGTSDGWAHFDFRSAT